jgi:hypothetical protein
LAARAGWKAAGKNAIIGGVLLALIEGEDSYFLGLLRHRSLPSSSLS